MASETNRVITEIVIDASDVERAQRLIAGAFDHNSASVDLLNFDRMAVLVNTGAIDSAGAFSAKFQDSDDNVTFADVDASEVMGSFPATFLANSVVKVGYNGNKRYVRLAVTKAGGTSIVLGALAVLGGARRKPVA